MVGGSATINDVFIPFGRMARIQADVSTVSDVTVALAGGLGNVKLFVPDQNGESTCTSTEFLNEDFCEIPSFEPDVLIINVIGNPAGIGATLRIDVDPITQTPPPGPLPSAICQHSIVAQVGNGFIAAITIANISDNYLVDWYVEWEYETDVVIDTLLNGIVTALHPFRAESPEPGRAISPGAMTTLYVFGTSLDGVINNPTVTGNFCD